MSINKVAKVPVIWGLDSVHGANYVLDAILTPQQINLASTFNESVAYRAGTLASKDTRAAGITWLFSPILGLALNPAWSRVYETMGEDPHLASVMGAELIKGIQAPDTDKRVVPSRAAACAKHFIGYSMPRSGHDRSPAWIPRRHLYQYFLVPWRRALRSGRDSALTVMESYSETSGVPNVFNFEFTRKLLRDDLSFEGVLVTDYREVMNLVDWHRVAADYDEAVKLVLRDSSVDMSMVPHDVELFIASVHSSVIRQNNATTSFPPIPESIDIGRIVESAERVVALKVLLGMYEERHRMTTNSPLIKTVGSPEDRGAALDMARQSIVLVENRNEVIPIEGAAKVHITGPTSNSLSYQSGGWTINWQGSPSDSNFSYGTNIVDAAKTVREWAVTTSCGVSILGQECQEDDGAQPDELESADYVIVCIGEENYAEKPGDITDLRLAQGQLDFAEKVTSVATGKVILVYFGGRPRVLGALPNLVDAIFIAFLPGPDGGRAVIDLVTGQTNPSARLPISYPRATDGGGTPYNSAVTDQCTRGDDELPHWKTNRCDVQWPFGHGLNYNIIEYDFLRVSAQKIVLSPGRQNNVSLPFVSVTVRNSGTTAQSHSVLFFLFDETRYVTPEYKRLQHFDKVMLLPGEEVEVKWRIKLEDLYHIGPHDDTHLVLQEGIKLRIGVGPDADCRLDSDSMCTENIQLALLDGEHYVGACDSACKIWTDESLNCADWYGLDWASCWSSCTMIAERNYDLHGLHEGWGWNYVECIESVSRGIKRDAMISSRSNTCWKMTAMCRDIFSTRLMDETGMSPLGGGDEKGFPFFVGPFAATISMVIGSTLIVVAFWKAGKSRVGKIAKQKRDGHIQFAPLSIGAKVDEGIT